MRERIIRRDAFARCPFSAAIECAERYLQQASARGQLEDLIVKSAIEVQVVEDFTDTVRRHDAIEFRWRPRTDLLPAGDALLTVRPHAPLGTELQFSIAYRPPLGRAGRIFDACVGRYIAWLTVGRLLRRLRVEIERCAGS